MDVILPHDCVRLFSFRNIGWGIGLLSRDEMRVEIEIRTWAAFAVDSGVIAPCTLSTRAFLNDTRIRLFS